nr:DnaJ domain protein [Ipomoea batatas]GMD58327.1 DnaJ domain protein [Ipomoea batatas]
MATRTENQNGGLESRTQLYLKAAEFFLGAKNFEDCRKNAFRAQALDPIHPGPTQLLAIAAVISAAADDGDSSQRPDYYSILGVPHFTADFDLIKTRFEKLCAILSPRENQFALAEEAYRLVIDAWLVLSVPAKRAPFDEELKRNPKFRSGSENPNFFWTMCPYCYHVFEYPVVFKECCFRCWNEKCRRAFHAAAIPAPPPDVVAMGQFLCAGFVPIRVENGMNSWTPFSPVGSETRARNENEGKGDGDHGDLETDGGNVARKKQKMAANSTKKVMGKGVRMQVINAAPLETTADDRASANNYTEVESELINGKLEFSEEGDDICVGFHPDFH